MFNLGHETSLSGEEISFIPLPLHPTHFTDGQASPAPRNHSLCYLTMSQRCDGAKASSLVSPRSPGCSWPNFLFVPSREAPSTPSRVRGSEPTPGPPRKWPFQEESSIDSHGPRGSSRPRDTANPKPHSALPLLPVRLANSSHQGLKKKLKFPSARLAGTFH